MTESPSPMGPTDRDPDEVALNTSLADARHRRLPWVSPGVASVAAASFFSDSGHEIATAVLPGFVTGVLHGSAGALGVIEGLSDALLGVAKLIGGPLADDPVRRVRLARGGYTLTALATAAIGLSATLWQAGVLRALGWVARGARGPARDTLLASLAPPDAYGRSFGVERAGDNAGAVVGPLLAAMLVATVGTRLSFAFCLIPGVLAAVAITVAAAQVAKAPRETAAAAATGHRLRARLRALRKAGLGRPLVPVALFELGNVATTLLILRATDLLHAGGRDLTRATTVAILIYAAHNVVATLSSLAGGAWADRSGPRVVLGAGAACYIAAYVGFALPLHAVPALLAAFCFAGAGIGLAETAESALVAKALPDHLRGSGFGLLGGLQSAGDFLSSASVGVLYAAVGAATGFGLAAGWMVLSLTASVNAPAER